MRKQMPHVSACVADCVRRRRRHGHRLIEQTAVLTAANELVAGLQKRKIGVVRHNRFGKRRELHALLAEFVNRPDDLVPSRLYRTGLSCTAAALATLMAILLFAASVGGVR